MHRAQEFNFSPARRLSAAESLAELKGGKALRIGSPKPIESEIQAEPLQGTLSLLPHEWNLKNSNILVVQAGMPGLVL